MEPLSKYFNVTYGEHELTSKELLDEGDSPVISSQGVDNGCYGFFNVKTKYELVISVPRTGSIGEAFVQDYSCTIDDNCLVLTPKEKFDIEYLYYIASMIRTQKWRYVYGRQITPSRIGTLEVTAPNKFKSQIKYDVLFEDKYPKKNKIKRRSTISKIKGVPITQIFDLERGHFHAIDALETGEVPTISRTSTDNGLVGFYKIPKKARIYPPKTITVSTVTGDAFLQFFPFIATDNVVLCIPKREFEVTTLVYIQNAINQVKWRYSYGRQCYKGTFQKTIIFLPIDKHSNLDEQYIKEFVEGQPYWQEYKKILLS